jgi:hypothetical protein
MKNLYVADFETTTTIDDVRVWGWGLFNIDKDTFEYGKDLDSFFKRLNRLPDKSKVYFHNLKFDGEFIEYYLFQNGYTHSEQRKLYDKEFSTLISDMGVWYSMKIALRGKTMTFIDSLKIIPLRVAQIAKAFNLPIAKGEIDYHKPRPIGYEPDDIEIAYIRNDVEIVASALKFFFDSKMSKMTIASNALAEYKAIIGSKKFERLFPVLQQDSILRKAYRGGFTYADPRFKGKDIKEGIVLDVNSLYPSVMYHDPLPYGEPIQFEGEYKEDEFYPLYIQTIRCNFELKEGHIPTIQLKNNVHFGEREYLTTSDGLDISLTLTSVDMALFFKHYNVYNLEFFEGWKFKASTNLFKDYIDKWSKVKIEADATGNIGLRTLAKLLLNSLYGKFGLNPIVKSKIPIYHDGLVKYHLTPPTEREPIYVPVACFITAYARLKTISSGQSVYDRFIYADTDSLHLIGTEVPDLDIHNSRMGAWKLENTFERARFLRAKTYMEVIDGKPHFTVAGLPESAKEGLTEDNFQVGVILDGKLQNKRVKGGIVLIDTQFSIKG